ncbi:MULTISPECIES: Tim44/TimA family putative adaptor protein [unclassified Bartonella]|uniref:Tim44/TimA family putative adaptor protein n=1 Tax=unclassified Bartonella TaxID=2645622 RepID=UPI000998F848|nr:MULTISPECIES: Tim44/TimA family putative adaptor protein [unclassified Bartonella]AQX28691.1 putative lipid-binding transport protein, Tim44 family [Bartonella sp. JB15]AQX29945.1 putative lipid-binding transport protein, Tim44 family [Bartonella sp. JB63]
MELDIVLIIALIVVVVVFVQLRNVLGKRIGFEKPPFDSYSGYPKKQIKVETIDNIIPDQSSSQKSDFSEIDAIASEGSKLNSGLRAILQSDPSFSPQFFTNGVKIVYEIIMTAFAQGDRLRLKEHLSSDVFESFCAAIEQREKNNERVQFTFIGINRIEFIVAEMQKKEAFLTVRIVSEMISATYNEQEKCIDGDPEAIIEIRDIWTFVRDTMSQSPNWKLFATEDEN